ncbi:MAG: LON peptidase substrate-binding domain-containing protein [Alphaproteobacteria bacterium]|nr:LON peptidase substrate-binding domain-containing protein [Alphaproteobacteria bacterium]
MSGPRAPSIAGLPPVIPVFPLAGALLLPRGRLPLNIFEPRYLAMIDDAMRTHRLIGMVQPVNSDQKHPPLYPIGCAGRLTSWNETGDGRLMITLTGLIRFRIDAELKTTTPYRQIEASFEPFSADLQESSDEDCVDRKRLGTSLKSYLKLRNIEADWSSIERAPGEVLINSLAMICPFDVAEKQALLEASCLADRAQLLTALIEMAAAGSGNVEGGPTLQ